jgi:hypothetical protein
MEYRPSHDEMVLRAYIVHTLLMLAEALRPQRLDCEKKSALYEDRLRLLACAGKPL